MKMRDVTLYHVFAAVFRWKIEILLYVFCIRVKFDIFGTKISYSNFYIFLFI